MLYTPSHAELAQHPKTRKLARMLGVSIPTALGHGSGLCRVPEGDTAMPARKSTGKRLRFEVFKRDHFTCQYCGAQPPDVVLVVDHSTPVALGGDTTIDNLITSCEPCNQGKADKPISTRQVRPDADLLYLETQQEIAELHRYQAAKAERDAILDEISDALELDFRKISRREWVVGDRVIRPLLDRYEPSVVDRAVRSVAYRIASGRLDTYGNGWIAYLNSVARRIAEEDEG